MRPTAVEHTRLCSLLTWLLWEAEAEVCATWARTDAHSDDEEVVVDGNCGGYYGYDVHWHDDDEGQDQGISCPLMMLPT